MSWRSHRDAFPQRHPGAGRDPRKSPRAFGRSSAPPLQRLDPHSRRQESLLKLAWVPASAGMTRNGASAVASTQRHPGGADCEPRIESLAVQGLYWRTMSRATVLSVLQQHRDELMRLGVLSLSIVGSVARDTSDGASDVDIAVRLSAGERGFAHLRRLDELEQRLSAILGRHVDLIEEPAASARVQREIDRDRVLAF